MSGYIETPFIIAACAQKLGTDSSRLDLWREDSDHGTLVPSIVRRMRPIQPLGTTVASAALSTSLDLQLLF